MRGCKREPERVPSFTTHFDSNRRFRTAHRTRVGARATSPSSGMSSITWTSRSGTGPRQIGSWLRRCPATGQLRAIGRSKRRGPSLVAGVRHCGEQGSVSGRSDHSWRRCEYRYAEGLQCRLRDGAWQALCRTVILCRFVRSRTLSHDQRWDHYADRLSVLR